MGWVDSDVMVLGCLEGVLTGGWGRGQLALVSGKLGVLFRVDLRPDSGKAPCAQPSSRWTGHPQSDRGIYRRDVLSDEGAGMKYPQEF